MSEQADRDPFYPLVGRTVGDLNDFRRFVNLTVEACTPNPRDAVASLIAMGRHHLLARGILVWTLAHGRYPRQPRIGEGPSPSRLYPPDRNRPHQWAGLLDILRRAGMHRDTDSIVASLHTFADTMTDLDDGGLRFTLALAMAAGELYVRLPSDADWVTWDMRALHLYTVMAASTRQLAEVHELVDATVATCQRNKPATQRILDRWVKHDLDRLVGRCLLAVGVLGLVVPERVKLIVREAGTDPTTPATFIDWADTSADSRLGVNHKAAVTALRLARAHASGDVNSIERMFAAADSQSRMAYGAAYAAVNMIARWLADIDTADRN